MKQILINNEEMQIRVAVVQDGVLQDFFMERTNRDQLVGSIFKGKIKNLEPSLQAAFVDIGCGKNAFLHYWDMLPATQEMLEDGGDDIDDEDGKGAGDDDARAARDEAKGASESVLKKGCPQISAEAKAALSVGKKLKKAKLTLVREGSDRWNFTFDADLFTMTGLTLPEGEEMDLHSKFEERIAFLQLLKEALEGYFTLFAKTVMDPRKRSALEKDMRTWAEERESF